MRPVDGLLAASGYGTRLQFKHSELFYTSDVTEEEAKRLGDYFLWGGFFGDRPNSVQLTKQGSTYQVRHPVNPGAEKNESYVTNTRSFAWRISERVFHGALVEVHLCNTSFNTLRVVPGYEVLDFHWNVSDHLKSKMPEFKALEAVDQGKVYYTPAVTEADARRLGEYLMEDQYFDKGQNDVELTKEDKVLHVRLVLPPEKQSETELPRRRIFGARMSHEIFRDAPLVIDVCSAPFETLRAAPADALLECHPGTLFYSASISRDDAARLGVYLMQNKGFNNPTDIAELTKEGQTVHYRLPVKPGSDKHEGYVARMRMVGADFSLAAFHAAPFEVDMCDARLRPLRAIPADHLIEFGFGDKIYYPASLSRKDARAMGEFFQELRLFSQRGMQVQVRQDPEGLAVRFESKPGAEKDEGTVFDMGKLAAQLSHRILRLPVTVEFCDSTLLTLRVIPALPAVQFKETLMYYTSGVSRDEVGLVGNFLVHLGVIKAKWGEMQIAKEGQTLHLQLRGNPGTKIDDDVAATLTQLATLVSQQALHGAPFVVDLADDSFRPFRSFPARAQAK